MPLVVCLPGLLGLRPAKEVLQSIEILVVFVVWSVMLEIWLPKTEWLCTVTYSDPWDVMCYAVGGIVAHVWWQQSYTIPRETTLR